MRQLNTQELKTVQLEILKYVAHFCDKNGIAYWLDSGTLLGAVRHKGYIPWDDDIDIAMLRDGYEKFQQLFNESNERYQMISLETNPDFYCSFAKVLDTQTLLYEPDENGNKSSINIDVFVHDNAPDDPKRAARMYKRRDRYKILNGIQTNCYNDHGKAWKKLVLRCGYAFTNLFPKNYFLKKIAKNSRRYENAQTKRVGNFVDIAEHMLCDKAALEPFCEVEFEGVTFKAPADYDAWLSSIYGDYMQLPPEQERVSHHAFKAYMLS